MKLNCPQCGADDVFEADFDTLVDDPKVCPQCGTLCEVAYDEGINDEGEDIGGFYMEISK